MKMRFVDIKASGSAEVLFVNLGPLPTLKPNEVMIRVKAAGVNRSDLLQRMGNYPPPQGASSILGLEVAGVIEGKGSEVTRWQIGDAVCALTNGGGYAEFCNVPESQCLPLPSPLNFIEAASLPETYFTVWSNVFGRARLKANETILIHAGGGGIGATAIQLAKAFGATVYTTASTKKKQDFCQSLNADHVILYHDEDFEEKIQQWTQGKGVDVILDILGGKTFEKNLRSLSLEGRLIQLAVLKGSDVKLDLSLLLHRRLSLMGSTLRPQSTAEKAEIAKGLREKVWPLFAQGKLKPIVRAVFALEQIGDAHRLMESRQFFGKVVLSL